MLSFVPRMIESGEPGVVVNTSSMDGGIAPVPYASVYASSKAAISCLTEALAHQLIAAGTDLRAAVFYPGGGLLDTGLWTAAAQPSGRARPHEAKAPGPGTTFEEFKAQLEAAGRPVEVMDLHELGRFCRRGREAGRLHHRSRARRVRGRCCTARADAIAGQLPPAALS